MYNNYIKTTMTEYEISKKMNDMLDNECYDDTNIEERILNNYDTNIEERYCDVSATLVLDYI